MLPLLSLLGCTSPPPNPTAPPSPSDTPPTDTTPEPTGDTGAAPPPPHPPHHVPSFWVPIPAGTFLMGTDPPYDDDEAPAHWVDVPAFALMRHEVTVAQYNACEHAGACTPRSVEGGCLDRDQLDRPANCLDYDQAGQVCAFLGGRRPTESEWEYAASSGGLPYEYPWGDEPPDCTRANMNQPNGWGSCDDAHLWEVCTHPAGDTPWGLCDMGGNAFEWIEDWHNDYAIHPTDGSAQTVMLFNFRGMRGGGVNSDVLPRVRERTFHEPSFTYSGMGVRCAMDLAPPTP